MTADHGHADGLLRIDLHTHTHYSPDGVASPRAFVSACKRKGLNCVAVTDHNTIEGALKVRDLAPFQVIIGEEIKSTEGEVIGLFLTEAVPPGLSAEETIARVRAQGGFVSLPHAVDRFRGGVGRERFQRLALLSDMVEVMNARTTVHEDNHEAARLAKEHGLIPVSVTDAHSTWELGRAYTEAPPFETKDGFLDALRQGRPVGTPATPLVHTISRFAVFRRKLGWRPK
jgi:predicted metal-dependent phosphoesterase TrpH